jgi:hypothetical protein
MTPPKFRCEMVPLQFSPLPFGWRYLFAQRNDDQSFSKEEADILGVAVIEEFYVSEKHDLEIGGEDKPAGRWLHYVLAGDGAPEIADDFFQGVENIVPVAVLRPGETADSYTLQFDEGCRSLDKRLAEAKQQCAARRNEINPTQQTKSILEEVCR